MHCKIKNKDKNRVNGLANYRSMSVLVRATLLAPDPGIRVSPTINSFYMDESQVIKAQLLLLSYLIKRSRKI